MDYLLIFFTSLTFTVLATPYFIRYLTKVKVVDLPGNRRIHTAIVPRMGGFLIYLSTSFTTFLLAEELETIRLLILAANIILLIGFFDDILGLDYSIKIWSQITACILVLFYLYGHYTEMILFDFTIPHPFDFVILAVFIVGGINSINFMDGIDGLVSGFSILSFIIIMILAIGQSHMLLMILAMSLIGSLLGFLRYNKYPAKIFLGDTGSLTLGYFLVISSLLISIRVNKSVLDLTFPIILLAVPLTDAVRVIVFRIIRKRSPFLPDKTHLHHLLMQVIGSQRYTVFIIESYSVLLAAISLYYLMASHFVSIVLFSLLALILFFIEPILAFLTRYKGMTISPKYLKESLSRNLNHLQRILLYLSSFALLVILILSIPYRNSLGNYTLLGFLVIGLAVFFIATRKKNIYNGINDIFIFMNLAAFFTIANLNLTLQSHFKIGNISLSFISEISYYMLTFIIIVFLIANDTTFPIKKLVINDVDYTFLIFLLLTFMVDYIVPSDLNKGYKIFVLEALIFYLWYKIVVTFKEEIKNHLFYLSFALSFAIVIRLLTIRP
ncbi:MAG: glycosyltransferase family 4 protein [Ignavibacteriales bacterium]